MHRLITEIRSGSRARVALAAYCLREDFADHHAKDLWAEVTPEELRDDPQIGQAIIDIITKSYASLGGHPDFKQPRDLESSEYRLIGVDIDADTDADVIRIAKTTRFGQKSVAGATDGTPAAKQIYQQSLARDLAKSGFYVEVSGAIGHILLTRYDPPVVDDEETVRRVLAGKQLTWLGAHPEGKYPGKNGWYVRTIGGVPHEKIMLGKPRI